MDNSVITLFYNCTILTMDQNNSEASAMAVLRGKIISIGSERGVYDEVNRYMKTHSCDGLRLLENDLGGACVVPGFIDAHLHPGLYVYYKTQVSLTEAKSYSELREILTEEDNSKSPGEWIFGTDLMEDIFEDPAERHFPTRYDLDQICGNRPVLIMRHDGHICCVNSAALQIMNVNKFNVREKSPTAGEIRVDERGEPTGIFTEGATAFATDFVPAPSLDRIKSGCKAFSAELASYGITTCGGILQTGEHGPAGRGGALELPLVQALLREGLVEQDFVFFLITDSPNTLKRFSESFQAMSGEEKYCVAGIKLFADGSFGASTAYMFEPFFDSPKGATGLLVNKKEDLHRLIKETRDLGFMVACHCIGDRANRLAVDIYSEVVVGTASREARFRIEHASVLTDDTIADIAKNSIILVCQPASINSEYKWLEKRLGSERCKHTYAFRSIIDAGVILAGASDAPIESANVMKAISACVTRNGFVPEQAITATEALRMFTFNAAYAIGQEQIKGSLEKDKLADFVVLGEDPRVSPSEKLSSISIKATFHRGKRIYPAE